MSWAAGLVVGLRPGSVRTPVIGRSGIGRPGWRNSQAGWSELSSRHARDRDHWRRIRRYRMAIALKQAAFDDFVILEKSDNLGGTWHHNKYPGCAATCRRRVSYSYELNPSWRPAVAPQQEIWEYLRMCAASTAWTSTSVTAARSSDWTGTTRPALDDRDQPEQLPGEGGGIRGRRAAPAFLSRDPGAGRFGGRRSTRAVDLRSTWRASESR